MKKVLVLILALQLLSCASYMKRQECEKINWFDYGQSVALDGRRLTGDDFLNQCQKAEADIDEAKLDVGFKSGLAKYCQPEMVYLTGKKGRYFTKEMCEGENLTLLSSKHASGVLDYCKKSNAYGQGLQGQPYNNICPRSLEDDFVPEFNRGRKKYLSQAVLQNQNEIYRLDSEAARIKNDLNYAQNEANRYRYNAKDPNNSAVMSDLNRRVFQLQDNLKAKESERDSLIDENKKLKNELIKLDGGG